MEIVKNTIMFFDEGGADIHFYLLVVEDWCWPIQLQFFTNKVMEKFITVLCRYYSTVKVLQV